MNILSLTNTSQMLHWHLALGVANPFHVTSLDSSRGPLALPISQSTFHGTARDSYSSA